MILFRNKTIDCRFLANSSGNGGLDAHMIMPGDDTVGGVGTVVRGWDGLVCGSGSS
jgi:hypothetical protein